MPELVRLEVPDEFAEELARVGFDVIEPVRGGGFEAQAVLTLVATGLGAAANLATIVVAKDAVADFTRRLRAWIARRAGSGPGGEVVVTVTCRSPGARTELRLVSRRTGTGGSTQVDLAALVSLLDGVFADGSAPPNPAGVEGPTNQGPHTS